MKLLITLIFTLALAGAAHAQAGALLGMAGRSMYNRFMATTPPPLPENMLGTSLSNALNRIPGADRMAKNTIRAVALFVNQVQRELTNMMDIRNYDMSSYSMDFPKILDGFSQAATNLSLAVHKLIGLIPSLNSLSELPSAIMNVNLVGSLTSVISSLYGLFSCGVNISSMIPDSLTALMDIPRAIIKDIMGSPAAFTSMMTRFMVKQMTGY